MKNILLIVIAAMSSVLLSAKPVATQANGPVDDTKIKKELRHELLMLPYYSLFDNIAFSVNDGTVTLMGQVVNPTLKKDAENVAKRTYGVQRVVNNIEVLPPLPMDDQIRREEFRAIYGDPALSKYAYGAVPPIHIIVKNGHVLLEGVVDNSTDKNIAEIRAKSVPNVFSVQNNLRVASAAE
jgi:hyperosmotically inducible protein